MKRVLNRVAAILVAAAVFLFSSYAAGTLLMPVREEYGCKWETFLQEPRNSVDVMFFGSSLVYCDVIPAVIWEETGLTSYVMAGPEQTIPLSYYYLKEACKTQHPQAVCVELTGMFFPKFTNYTKANIGYMPWGINRIRATIEAAEPELQLGLFFPLYDYHDCIYTVKQEAINSHLMPGTDIYAGYTYLTDSKPQGEITYRNYSAESEKYSHNLEYLKRIAEYCREENITLICYIAPVVCQIPTDALEALKADLHELECVFYDCNDSEEWPELTELDNSIVWFDTLHYNINGAIPFSSAFSLRLLEQNLTAQQFNADLWQERVNAIKAEN